MTPDELVEFVEGLARIAAAGGGTRALAQQLSEHLGAGVRIEDSSGRPLAVVGPSRNGARIDTPITAGTTFLGQLTVHTKESPSTVLALRLTAATLAVELARESGGNAARQRGFWERLANGGYHDFASARSDAQARGIVLAPHYLAIAIEPLDVAATVVTAFSSGEATLGILERDASLLVLVPVGREIDAANARTAASLLPKTLAKVHPGLEMTGGIGTLEAAAELSRGVAAADAALAIGRRLYGSGRITAHDELGAYALLLGGGDADALRAFANATLAPLRAYDEKHQTELERTLRFYFACGQNVKTAAAELHVHRHTVFYRLRQIGEICGRSLDSPHDQLTFRMATAIDALHS